MGHTPSAFMSINCKVHIGSEIRNKLSEQGRSVSWLADHLCYERTNIYRIFRARSIDTDTLYRISVLLNFDFFKLYSVDF